MKEKQTWVNIALYEDRSAGESLAAFLRGHKIEARTYDDKVLQMFLFLCPPRMTFRVQIHDKFYKLAAEVLEANAPPVLLKAIHCPDCGSLRVNYPQMTRKFFLPTILLHLGIIFRVIDHEAYCENCHCIWNLPKAGAPVQKPQLHRPFFPFK